MPHEPTIRLATEEDAPLIRSLCNTCELSSVPGKRYVLVLDAPEGGLAAVAEVVMERAHGHVSRLAIAPGHEGAGVEERLIAVAEALCEAYGFAA